MTLPRNAEKHYQKILVEILDTLLAIYLLVLALRIVSGGFSIVFFSTEISIYSLSNLLRIFLSLLAIRFLISRRMSTICNFFFQIEELKFTFFPLLAGFSFGFFNWSTDHQPTDIHRYFFTNEIDTLLRQSIINEVCHTTILIFIIWLLVSRLISYVNRESLDTSLVRTSKPWAVACLLFLFPLIHHQELKQTNLWPFLGVFVLAVIASLNVSLFNPPKARTLPTPPGEKNSLKRIHFADIAIYLFIALHVFTYAFLNYWGHYNFITRTRDLGLVDQLFWNTMHGKFFYSQIVGDFNFLGRHFSLIYLFILPLYALWSDPRLLMAVGNFTMAIAALPLYLLARDLLKNRLLALSFALAYLLVPFFQYFTLFDFHEVQLEPPLIIFAFYYLYRRRYLKYAIFLALLLLVKEDTFLFAFIIGFFAFFVDRKRIVGAVTMAGSLIWGVAVLKFFMPHFAAGIKHTEDYFQYLERYAHLGSNFKSIMRSVFFNPVYVLDTFFHLQKLEFILGLLFPVAFMPIFSGAAILLFIPALVELLLSTWFPMYSLRSHFIAAVFPFVFISALYGTQRFLSFQYLIPFSKHRHTSPHITQQKRRALATFLIVAGLAGSYYLGPAYYFPLARKFSLENYRPDYHTRLAHQFIEMVPPGSNVYTRYKYHSHFTHKADNVHNWRYLEFTKPVRPNTYIFLDDRDFYTQTLAELLYNKQFGVKDFRDGYLLLSSDVDPSNNDETFLKIHTIFEGEKMRRITGTRKKEQKDAFNYSARYAKIDKHQEGWLSFGPYKRYPAGEYSVEYRLKVDDNTITDVIALIDVTTGDGTVIQVKKSITGTDFSTSSEYQNFTLNFPVTDEQAEWEFRLYWTGKASLWFDRIQINNPQMDIEKLYQLILEKTP